jgi:LDH2 family malate/lactate/ureidoglycolate dehydrogenase
MNSAETFPAPVLHRFTRRVFTRAGLPANDATILADHLIWSDLRGLSKLGVNKIPPYLARLRAGGTRPDAAPEVIKESPTLLVVDGHDGFGQVICFHTMKMVIAKARSTGLAAAVIRNSSSAGALGVYAEQAAEQRLVGLAITNALPLVAAPGGAEKVVGNQAFALAAPAGRHRPLLYDAATSAITWVRIFEHRLAGAPLPEGVALTAEAEPTVDPEEAMKGILLPMAGHRGFGLALLWEVLTGVLSGGERFSTNAGAETPDRPEAVSVFLLALDPTVVQPYDAFVDRVDTLIDNVHNSRRLPGTDRLTVPGERSGETRHWREADGIPVPADLLTELRTLGAEFGIIL